MLLKIGLLNYRISPNNLEQGFGFTKFLYFRFQTHFKSNQKSAVKLLDVSGRVAHQGTHNFSNCVIITTFGFLATLSIDSPLFNPYYDPNYISVVCFGLTCGEAR
jgi:hypothetical protein